MTFQKSKQVDLSIVIPAYCEEKRIGKTLDKLAIFLKHDSYFGHKAVEVIVVAANAPDRTEDIILSKQHLFKLLKIIKPKVRVGKGRDVRLGMMHATGEIIVFMDADLATPLHHLEKFYKACDENDIVIGTRNLLKYRPNFIRRIFAIVGNVLFRLVSGIWIEDSQCGFKMFKRKAARKCFFNLTILGWGFDMEVLAIARTNRMKIKYYRINDWKDIPGSTFTDGLFKTSLHSLRDLAHIKIKLLKDSYNL
jgi:glycosyltransferase involved in cell wall biosynthesis